jgi:small subunit ribosomal protein S16
MATKIRLTRLGKKKQPTYRVVVMDSRKPRDGRYIEQLGIYDPRQDPSLIKIDNERALHWLRTGAQPTERARKLLEISGAWTQFKVEKGEIHTVGDDQAEEPAKVVAEAVVEEIVEEAIEEPVKVVAEAVVEEIVEEVIEVAAEEDAVDSSDES